MKYLIVQLSDARYYWPLLHAVETMFMGKPIHYCAVEAKRMILERVGDSEYLRREMRVTLRDDLPELHEGDICLDIAQATLEGPSQRDYSVFFHGAASELAADAGIAPGAGFVKDYSVALAYGDFVYRVAVPRTQGHLILGSQHAGQWTSMHRIHPRCCALAQP
jgi:hypothetical protein